MKKSKQTIDLVEIRKAVANYISSQDGWKSCQGEAHRKHKEILAKSLKIPKYEDGSGYDFLRFANK